jgi:hypothetical protein
VIGHDPELNGDWTDEREWRLKPTGAARAEIGHAEAEPDMAAVKAELEQRAANGLRVDGPIPAQVAAKHTPWNAAWVKPHEVDAVLARMRAAKAAMDGLAMIVTTPDGRAEVSAPDEASRASIVAMARQQADRLGPLSGTVG